MTNIFIVDDDENIVFLFEELLKMKGHKVIAKAFNGEQAVKIYSSLRISPDIILMDHRMPKKNGLTAAKEILGINPDCKIIFISADHSIKNQALKIGAIFFMEKPIKFPELLMIINQAISPSNMIDI
ncbi:MAG: response regulator [Candidatus Hodarchaeales archaeon]|jgi:two-component system chemotaxis response regulator CheY